jgi:hypothetical protein
MCACGDGPRAAPPHLSSASSPGHLPLRALRKLGPCAQRKSEPFVACSCQPRRGLCEAAGSLAAPHQTHSVSGRKATPPGRSLRTQADSLRRVPLHAAAPRPRTRLTILRRSRSAMAFCASPPTFCDSIFCMMRSRRSRMRISRSFSSVALEGASSSSPIRLVLGR